MTMDFYKSNQKSKKSRNDISAEMPPSLTDFNHKLVHSDNSARVNDKLCAATKVKSSEDEKEPDIECFLPEDKEGSITHELKALRNDLTELVKINKAQSREIDKLVLEIKDLKNEIKDLKNEIKDLKNEIKDLKNEIKDLKNESKDLKNEIKDLNNRTSGLEKLTQKHEETLRTHASEIKTIKADLHKLRSFKGLLYWAVLE